MNNSHRDWIDYAGGDADCYIMLPGQGEVRLGGIKDKPMRLSYVHEDCYPPEESYVECWLDRITMTYPDNRNVFWPTMESLEKFLRQVGAADQLAVIEAWMEEQAWEHIEGRRASHEW